MDTIVPITSVAALDALKVEICTQWSVSLFRLNIFQLLT
jgi:hypothetical protein